MEILELKRLFAKILNGERPRAAQSGTRLNALFQDDTNRPKRPLKLDASSTRLRTLFQEDTNRFNRPLIFDASSRKVHHTHTYIYICIYSRMEILEWKRLFAKILKGKVRNTTERAISGRHQPS